MRDYFFNTVLAFYLDIKDILVNICNTSVTVVSEIAFTVVVRKYRGGVTLYA